jgi:hypothetical protein
MLTLLTSAAPRRAGTYSICRLGTLALLVSIGCGGDNAGPHNSSVSSLHIVSGDNQTGAAGSALPQQIVVAAAGADGQPVAGVAVAFTVSAGGGSVSPTSATTDAAGKAAATWTVGTKPGDVQQLTATTGSVTPATAAAVVVPGAPAALDATPASIAGRAGLQLPPFTVTVRDQFGNRASVAGLHVFPRLDANAPLTLLGAAGVATDTSGAVVSGLSITGKGVAATLVVESGGLTPAHVSVTLGGGTPVATQPAGKDTVDANAGVAGPPIAATAFDEWQNTVAGVDVTFAIVGGGVLGHATSDSNGVATLSTWTAPALGSYQVTASVTGGSTSARYTLITHRLPPTTLAALATNPTSGLAGLVVILDVKATDTLGHPVPDSFLTWSSDAGTGGQNTDGSGVAHLFVRLGTKAGPAQVLVQAGPNVSTTLNIQITHTNFARIVTPADTATAPAGSKVVITLTTTDVYGNSIPGQLVYAWAFDQPLTASTITPTATSDSAGDIQFTVSLDPYAGRSIFGLGTSPVNNPSAWIGTTSVYGTSSRGSFRILPTGCSAPVNTPLKVSVSGYVFDSTGHFTTGVPVTWSPPAGNGFVGTNPSAVFFQSATVVSDTAGQSSIFWSPPTTAGTYQVIAQPPAAYGEAAPAAFLCRIG